MPAHKPDKGRFNGSCNREACQKAGANWWNISTKAYYCRSCAHLINEYPPQCCYLDEYNLMDKILPLEKMNPKGRVQ